ncbi:MAG TPA: hypothetical protein VGE28_07360 [Pseudomonas sp.]
MALGDARRAGGDAIEKARRGGGDAMEKARRDAGKQMEATRRGEAVAEDINSLVRPQRQARSLPRVAPVGALPAQRSSADYKAPASTGTAGIASPLTEQNAATRTYWPGGWPSNDGLLVLPAIRQVQMTDANGAEVIFDYADPSA